MFGLGFWELVLILVIVLVIFGGAKLPQLGRSLGEAIRGLKHGLNEGQDKGAEAKPIEPAKPDDQHKEDKSDKPDKPA